MFSISVRERNNFAENYFQGNSFIPVFGVNNRSYLIFREAILDVYLPDDGADSVGPEDYIEDGIMGLDDECWEILEKVETGVEIAEQNVTFDLCKVAHVLMIAGHKPEEYTHVLPDDFDFITVKRVESFSEYFHSSGDCEKSTLYLDFDHRGFTVMTDANSLNYVSCPTHAYEKAVLQDLEDEIDG